MPAPSSTSASCTTKSRGIAQDTAAAIRWWTKAADQGDVLAQHSLAQAYIAGNRGRAGLRQGGGPGWKRRRDKGLVRSQYTLGKMFHYGLGVSKDFERAFTWIKKAAEAGFDKAQYNLGKFYRDGHGTPEDAGAAARWFMAAAEQGYAKAQNHIGVRLARGVGVPKDEVRALMWLTLAAARKHTQAIDNREALAKTLSPGQVAEAERLAEEWKPRKPR